MNVTNALEQNVQDLAQKDITQWLQWLIVQKHVRGKRSKFAIAIAEIIFSTIVWAGPLRELQLSTSVEMS